MVARGSPFLKIRWEIYFLIFLNTDQNAPIFFLELLYGHSHFKSAFGINFRLREVVKLKILQNTQIREFAYFQFDHFPKSKINSERRFEMRMSILLF